MEEKNNISQEVLETLERYLNNTMLSDERTSFEKQLEVNPILQQHLNETKILFSGIKKAALKNKLDSFHEGLVEKDPIKKEPSKIIKFNFRFVSIAASILVLIGGFWYSNQSPTNQKLFDQYFVPDRGLATKMSGSGQYEFNDAMVDYKNTKYDLAIEKWEVLLKSKPQNDTLNYFLGSAYLANQKEDLAVAYFNTVLKTQSSEFIDETYYYLGLAYLKLGNTPAALENLKKSKSPKSEKIIAELSD